MAKNRLQHKRVYKAEIQIKKREPLTKEGTALQLKKRLLEGAFVSNSDWPIKRKKKIALKNLKLLQQYLTFVSNEVNEVILSDNKIQLNISSDSKPIQPLTEEQKSCRLGATLIEAYVHDQKPEQQQQQQEDCCGDTEHQQTKQDDSIQCICDSPHEDYGEMVQCDNCYHWLHLECLDLNRESLKEVFHCPACCKNEKLSWRYAAQWESQRLAARREEYDEDEDDDWADNFSQSSISQVNTPATTVTPPIVLWDFTMLSHVAYLDTVREEIFSPTATDVFLSQNESSNIPLMNSLEASSHFAANNVPPSDMCSQDLSKFSFDSGPFWDSNYPLLL